MIEKKYNPDGTNFQNKYRELYDELVRAYESKIRLLQKKIIKMAKTKLVDQGEVSNYQIKMEPRMDTSGIVLTNTSSYFNRKARTGAITCTKGFKIEFDLEVPWPDGI